MPRGGAYTGPHPCAIQTLFRHRRLEAAPPPGRTPMETKARSEILPEDIEQCLLYLHQGNYRLCLLVNFGQKPLGVRRFMHTPAGSAAGGARE